MNSTTLPLPPLPYGGLVTFTGNPPPPVPPTPPTVCGLYTTNKQTDGWRDDSASGQAALTGVVPGIIHRFQPWLLTAPRGGAWGAWDTAWAQDAAGLGCMPLITWEGRDLSLPNDAPQPAFGNAAVCRGDWDATLIAWLTQAGTWGKPFLLRLFHEGNGAWYAWAAGQTGNTAGSFIDAFRHVARLVRAHAPAARIVWNVGVLGNGWLPLEDCYPGHAYVDVLSVDYYNEPPGDSATWREFSTITPWIDRLAALAPGLPILVAETGCRVTPGADVAGWYGRIPVYCMSESRLTGMVFFDQVESDGDFRVSNPATPAIYAAYKALITDGRMRGRWP